MIWKKQPVGSKLEAISSKLATVTSGSLHDIKASGAYYITNAVTDKPTSTGGSYVVGSNGNVVCGLFTQNSTGNSYIVKYDGSTWSTEQVAINSNVLPQLFFGNGKGKHYGMTSKASIDAAVDNTVSPTNDNDGFFTIDNAHSITNFGNRQFLFGWLNTGKTYGWVIICSFGHVAIGTRSGSTSFTIIDISAINSKSSGTLDPTAYTTHVTADVKRVEKRGKVAFLELYLETENGYTIPTATNFCNIPSGFRPVEDNLYNAMIRVGETWLPYLCSINTSGQIKQSLTANCTGISFSASYPCE